MASRSSTAAGPSSKKAQAAPAPIPQLVPTYRAPDLSKNPRDKVQYDVSVKVANKIINFTEEEILEKSNPFDLKSRSIAPQFAAAIKVPMAGVPPPPPFSPLTPENGRKTAPRLSHNKQQDATFIDPPRASAETIDLSSNPDAIAVKANLGILMYQEKKVIANIKRLDMLAVQAEKYPKEFAMAILSGDIKITDKTPASIASWLPKYVASGAFKAFAEILDPEEEKKRVDKLIDEWTDLENMEKRGDPMTQKQKNRLTYFKHDPVALEALPEPVTVSKMPAINWAQYGVVGDSLDAVHANVLKTLGSDKKPEEIATDGSIKGNFGLPDARYMDRESYVAQAQEEDAAKKRKQ